MTKGNLQKGLSAYALYKATDTRTLGAIYKSYSCEKYIAFSKIFNEAATLQAASSVRVFHGNCFTFSMAFEYEKNDEKYFVYHTASNRYEWRVRDLLTFEKKENNLKKVIAAWGNDELKGKKYIDFAKAELKAVIKGGYDGLINFYNVRKGQC